MKEIMDAVLDEMTEITAIADEVYSRAAGNYFDAVRDLSDRFQANQSPITDSELEFILTSLPLKLFEISEAKSKVMLTHEIVKLKSKEKSDESLDYKLAAAVYNSVITRIDREMMYTRELIMSSKKLWEARKASQDPPVGEVVMPDLPDYDNHNYSTEHKSQSYIK